MSIPNESVMEIWDESTKVIYDRFGFSVPSIQKMKTLIDSSSTARAGGVFDLEQSVLYLTEDTLKGEIPLEGVIHRECLYSTLPATLCEEARRDLGYEFARQMLNRKAQAQWVIVWNQIPLFNVGPKLTYKSYANMNWLYRLSGGGHLDELIHEFMSMSKYGLSLTFEDYVKFIYSKAVNTIVKVNHGEVKILGTLLSNPNISHSEIANRTGFSDSWVSTQIKDLKEKRVLAEYSTTPFSKTNIRLFHLLMSGPAGDDPVRYLSKCPFLYGLQYILNGPWQIWARFAVPDNKKSESSIKKAVAILNDQGIATDLTEVHSVGLSYSFYHYNTSTSEWKIPWIVMRGWGHRIQDEALDQIVEKIDIPAVPTKLYLDSLDMKILSLVWLRINTTRALRQKLAIGQNKLSTRLERLRKEGLIRQFWDVFNVGLVEHVALRTTDRQLASWLDTWSRELPRVNLHYGEQRDSFFTIDLPMGDSLKLMNTLRELEWLATVLPLGNRRWGRWGFPKQLWDVESQSWRAPIQEIEAWLDSLYAPIKDTEVRIAESTSDQMLARI